MQPHSSAAPRPGRVPRRGRLLAVRAAVIGAALVCVTACGAAGASPAGPAEGSAAPTNNVPTNTVPTGAVPPGAVPSGDSPTGSASDDTAAESSPAAPTAPPTASGPAAQPSPATSGAALVLPASTPVSVTVPAIGISSPLIELGRNPDGTVEVPSLDDPASTPGWYRNSPSPGTLGPAIILGHVDSRVFGPGVFYSLQNLRPGDSIEVARADGTVAEFSIDSVQTVQKSDFPTLQVYGNLDHAGLRLITCGGEFDPNARSYESNIIVFASLVGSRSA